MKTPIEFADFYLNKRISFPLIPHLVKNKKARSKIRAITKLKLKHNLEEGLYKALHELMMATALARQVLKETNREIAGKRNDAIKYLKRALKYSRLSKHSRDAIETEIRILKAFDEEKQTYHPIKEIDYIRTVFMLEALEESLEKIKREHRIPPDEEEMELESLHHKVSEKLSKLEGQPMNVKEGRPSKFFFKVLQIVIFKLLYEQGKIKKEAAKFATAEIINEYTQKDPLGLLGKIKNLRISPVKSKDVDNAIHS